jgi:thioredoxin-related protein
MVSSFALSTGGLGMDRRSFIQLSMGAIASQPLLHSVLAAAETGKVSWFTALKPAHQQAISRQKPLLIIFGASWCGFCHKLEKETLGDKKLAQFVMREFVPVKLDFDKDDKAAKVLEVEVLPATVIINTEAELLARSNGFHEADKYAEILHSAIRRQTEILQARHTTTKPS